MNKKGFVGPRGKDGRFKTVRNLIDFVICQQCNKEFKTMNEYQEHAYHAHLYPKTVGPATNNGLNYPVTKDELLELFIDQSKKIDNLNKRVSLSSGAIKNELNLIEILDKRVKELEEQVSTIWK